MSDTRTFSPSQRVATQPGVSSLSNLSQKMQKKERPTRMPRIRFYSPAELRAYEPDNDIKLVGNCHVMRGEVFVVGGEPGVGKSRAATALAIAGATGQPWLGLSIHRQFRTMIVQTENGRFRLKQEFDSINLHKEIESWVRVSEPPPFGLTLTNSEFQEDIKAELEAFRPDCVILDPWNAAARDDRQKDYTETFEALRRILPTGPDKPALGIIAHTRKPKTDEKRTGGTGLMHLLAGSYILTSVPRSIFVMIPGSEDETDDSVVWFNPKNSNGPHAARSAWHREAGGFTSHQEFDWKEFDKPADKRVIIHVEHLAEVFKNGDRDLELKDAAHALASLADINERSAYNALSANGRFKENLRRNGNTLSFVPVHSSNSVVFDE
ncbi:MAG: AAA family ATPase [Chthoniobacterales bacterium]